MASNNIFNNSALNGFIASGGTISIATDAIDSTTNVGTGAAIKTVTFGSNNGASTTTVQSGSGALNITGTNGAITINSGVGQLDVSDDASDMTLNIATGGAVKTVTLGSTSGASTTTVQSGSGALNIGGATNAAVTINSGVGQINISNDASNTTVNIAVGSSGTPNKPTTLGSTNTTSVTTVQAGSNGVQIGSNSFLNMPTTTSTAGILKINNINMLHTYHSSQDATLFMGGGGYIGQATTFGTNTGIGKGALDSVNNAAGYSNTCVGVNAGTGITSGQNNLMVGWGTGSPITTGSLNCHVGYNAGSSSGTGNASTIYINNVGASESNVCRIGAATGTGEFNLNQSFIHGIVGITTVNNNAVAVLIDSAGQLGTVSSSIRYKENIQDMGSYSSSLLKLRPVTFDLIKKSKYKKCVGLIAEEVEVIAPNLVAYNQEKNPESIKYHDLPAMLLNELQKLLQRIDILEGQLNGFK